MLSRLLPLAAAMIGYLIGRTRPAHSSSDWTHWQVYGRRIPRWSWRWWICQPMFAVEIALLLVTQPRRTARAWRTRNDPPPKEPTTP